MLPLWPAQDLLGPDQTFQEPCNEIRAVRINSCESQFPLGVLSVYENQIQKTGLGFFFFPLPLNLECIQTSEELLTLILAVSHLFLLRKTL